QSRVSGVIGASYFHLDESEMFGGRRATSLQNLGVPQLLTAPAPAGLGLPPSLANAVLALYAPANPLLLDTEADAPVSVESYAAFADLRFELTDRLTIFGGARYDIESQETAFSNTVTVANRASLPDPTNPALSPLTAQVIAGLNARLFQMAA